MKECIMNETILNLRKEAGITQEELASALHISAQAVSKWETNTCFPDTQILPLIADYFKVSIDYLFYGKDVVYDDIYDKVQEKTASYPQQSKESYEEAHRLFAMAHHGITHGNLCIGGVRMYDVPAHISDYNGLSLLSGKGYGAIITRDFFKNITQETLNFSRPIFDALAKPNVLEVVSAIVSMSDISRSEMQDKLKMNDQELQRALDEGISCGLIIENVSKHKVLGKTYEISRKHHTCICILLATMEMLRYSLEEMSCCAGFGDYPVMPDQESAQS